MSGRSRAVVLAAGIGAGAALAASGALDRPAAFLLGLLPPRVAAFALGGELVALHSRLLGVFIGLALALVCGLALWRRRLCCRPDFDFLKARRGKFLFLILIVLAVLALSLSVNRVFWDDEIEHVHAAWYVHSGQIPYRDFFEHHHPLLWFLLAPLLALLGEELAVLAAARLLMLLMAAAIAWLTWRIARLAGGDAETGFLSVALLFSQTMFLPCVIEVRPDVPMVLLALAAVERLLVFMKRGRQALKASDGVRTLATAAWLAALSFLFLQKAVFLLPAAAGLLLAWIWSGRISIRLAWKAVALFLLPLLLFCAWMVAAGFFGDYFRCNWLLNAGRRPAFAAWLNVGSMALANAAFWVFLAAALPWALRRARHISTPGPVVALFGLCGLLALALLPNPADRHFLLPLPLLCVVTALYVGSRPFFAKRGLAAGLCLVALLALPLVFLAVRAFPFNGSQLEKIAFVLERTRPDQRVLDGRNDFNLFRPDCHYFWFQVEAGGMMDDFRRAGGQAPEYDPCRLLREKRPKAAYLDAREWQSCRVWRDYLPTPYANLFIRDDGTGAAEDG